MRPISLQQRKLCTWHFILLYRTRSLICTLNFFGYVSHRQEVVGTEPCHTGWLQQPQSLPHLWNKAKAAAWKQSPKELLFTILHPKGKGKGKRREIISNPSHCLANICQFYLAKGLQHLLGWMFQCKLCNKVIFLAANNLHSNQSLQRGKKQVMDKRLLLMKGIWCTHQGGIS